VSRSTSRARRATSSPQRRPVKAAKITNARNPTWHKRQPPHPGGPKGQGMFDDANPPGYRTVLARRPVHNPRTLARVPCQEKPTRPQPVPVGADPSRTTTCPRKRRQLRKLHCVSASRGVQPVSRCNAESPSNLSGAITPRHTCARRVHLIWGSRTDASRVALAAS
jgi:hypothetical protein